MDIFNSPEYKRSRKAYVTQCTLEHLIVILVGDAFLAKLLSNVGFKNSEIGVISSLISLAFIVQLFSIRYVRIYDSRGGPRRCVYLL